MAEVHKDYLDYLVDAGGESHLTDDSKSVLNMQTFGPLNVERSEDMREFAIFMTAVTLFFKSKMH